MNVIASGEIRVMAAGGNNGGVELARRKPGDYVGEMAILSHEPRMVSLVAVGDVRTLCIEQKQFEGILRERPETSLAVMRVLCARLREKEAPQTATSSFDGSGQRGNGNVIGGNVLDHRLYGRQVL